MKTFIVVLCFMLPLVLFGIITANFYERSRIETLYNYQVAIMDTDSTFCMYNWNNNLTQQRNLKLKRLHANGTIEDEQVLLNLNVSPGNTGVSYHYTSDGFFLIWSNGTDIISSFVNGDSVQTYSLPFASIDNPQGWGNLCKVGDSIYFISRYYNDPSSEFYLWKWDYAENNCSMIFNGSGYFEDPSLTAFGDTIVMSETRPDLIWGEQALTIVIDNMQNPVFHYIDQFFIRCTYSFGENTYYAHWNIEPLTFCGGIVYLGDTMEFTTMASSGCLDESGEGFSFRYEFANNLHGAWYYWASIYGDYQRFNLYQHVSPGNVVEYHGFENFNSYPNTLFYAGKMQEMLLLIDKEEDLFTFRIADPATTQWATFTQNQWQPEQDSLLLSYTRVYNSNDHLLLELSYNDANMNQIKRYYFFKLNLSVSSDDPVSPPPMYQAFPNPFTDCIQIHSKNPKINGSLSIFNLRGQKVRSLASSAKTYEWDGRDDRGRELSAGIYFARESDSSQTIKLIKLSQ